MVNCPIRTKCTKLRDVGIEGHLISADCALSTVSRLGRGLFLCLGFPRALAPAAISLRAFHHRVTSVVVGVVLVAER